MLPLHPGAVVGDRIDRLVALVCDSDEARTGGNGAVDLRVEQAVEPALELRRHLGQQIAPYGHQAVAAHAEREPALAQSPGLARLAERHPLIGEVRGEGVFWAVELVADRATREPVGAALMGRIKGELVARGLLPLLAENRIHVVPPCVVTADEVREALSIYDEALGAVAAQA